MFNVTDKYIEAAHSTSRETDLRGRIILKSGTVVNFTANDVLQGSTSYSNKCLNSETFTLGSCYIGEYKTTLKSNIDRYSLFGATIIVEYLLRVDVDMWEPIPIGIFTITSANRMGKYIEIDSFDNMSLLETPLNVGTSGTAVELMDFISKECKIDIGMTDTMWSELVNTEYVFAFSETDYSTFRDMLSDLATMLGGFATVDRYGCLVIKPFKTAAVDTVNDRIRTASKFEDYKCTYTSVTLKVDGTQYHAAEEVDDGLNVLLYDNKIAAANPPDQIEIMLANILAQIKTINYTPCETTMLINPAFELGDVLEFTGYNTGDQTIKSYVHSIDWSFRNSMTIKGVGENSKIANAKSIADKNATSASTSLSKSEMKTLTFTNSDEININGDKKKILDFNFSANYSEIAMPIVSGQFIVDVQDPAIFRLTYELNNEELDFKPEETVYGIGNKTFTFIKALPNVQYEAGNKLRVYLEALPLTIKDKELVKDTSGNYTLQETETTHRGKATILPFNIDVILQSSNLSFAEKWDGNFEIQDTISNPVEVKVLCTIGNKFSENYNFNLIDYDCIGKISDTLIEVEQRGTTVPVVEKLDTIIDYDVVRYYDIPYKELQLNSSDSGTFATNGFVTYPPGADYATCAIGYYMQLSPGVSVKINIKSKERTQIYLMDELTTDEYNFDIVGENNTIKYTSSGVRFWIIALTNNRQANGEYVITSELIDDPNGVYIEVENGYIGEDTTKSKATYRAGDSVSIMGNLPSSGQYFNSWKTSNYDISRKQNYNFEAAFDGIFTATYTTAQPEPAPCAFIGKTSRAMTENNFKCALETDDENITMQRIAVISTKKRDNIDKLTYEDCDGENIVLEREITDNFPNGLYDLTIPVAEQDEDLYLRIEIKYAIGGIEKYTYSNIVETHFADDILIL